MSLRINPLLTEKYRPKTIEDIILPTELKSIFSKFVEQKSIPNLMLIGKPGMGKTTVAKAMCEEIGADYIVINGSMNGNIDTLRNEIMNFASTVSLTGGRKYVILDEGDYLNPTSTQPALRNFMEEFSTNCGFIITANYASKIIKELHSRCSVVEFKIPKGETSTFAMAFLKRVLGILDAEGIEYDKKAVAEFIQAFFPDLRRVLNEIQRYSALGKIDSGILASVNASNIDTLITHIKGKNYTESRRWIAENMDSNVTEFFRKFYDTSAKFVSPALIPSLVVIIGKYQYQAAFVADQEVNFAAFVAELILEGIYESV
jgi:replication factor C small subunit